MGHTSISSSTASVLTHIVSQCVCTAAVCVSCICSDNVMIPTRRGLALETRRVVSEDTGRLPQSLAYVINSVFLPFLTAAITLNSNSKKGCGSRCRWSRCSWRFCSVNFSQLVRFKNVLLLSKTKPRGVPLCTTKRGVCFFSMKVL